MERIFFGLRVTQSWKICSFFAVSYFMLYQECSGDGDPKNYLINNFNKEQASRSYYPANFQRLRRGYAGSEESDGNNFAQFQSRNPQFGSFQKRGGGSHNPKGGSRGFGSSPAFGGPDAFLSSAHEDQEAEDEPINYPFSSHQGFPSMGSSRKGWPNSFSSGRSKGGGISSRGSSKTANQGSYKFGSANNRYGPEANQAFAKSGQSSSFSASRPNRADRHFANFRSKSNSQSPVSGGSFQPKSSMTGSFPNPFSEGSDPETSNRETPIILGSKNDFGAFSGKIEDLTGGNIIGSLGNLNAEDLARLLRQLDPVTTTKKPNRIILDEDKDKIFSGGQNSEENSFGGITNLAAMQQKKVHNKGIAFKSSDRDSVEDCKDQPTAVNARVRCTSSSGCRLDCFPNHRTPSGATFAYLRCVEGAWYDASGLSDVPNCQPICNPSCKNDGICLSPNVCSCSDNWEGPTCDQPVGNDFMKCSDKPPTPMNSRIFCSIDECIARCTHGYEFAEGITRLTFVCETGNWEVQSYIDTDEPNCIPACYDPCQNGGLCIAPSVCECSKDFRGPQCQYPTSNCDPLKLNFNGGHNCSGEGMNFGCKFWCPAGVNFTFPASDFYQCDYETAQWSPTPVPECDYGFLSPPTHQQYRQVTTIEKVIPKPGICFSWSNSHFKTFDGEVYSFESNCTFTLLQDSILGTFSVNLIPEENCMQSKCRKTLKIFTEGDQYTLSADSDQPILTYRESSLAVPGQINDLVSEKIAHFVILKFTAIGLTIKWDLEKLFILEVGESLWNRTTGLCGTNDGSKGNDIAGVGNDNPQLNLLHFLAISKADPLLDKCSESPIIAPKCTGRGRMSGKKFCSRITEDAVFEACRQVLDANDYVATCEWDYCNCLENTPEECACQSVSAFVKDCTSRGRYVQDSWRSKEFCPINCKKGLVYKTCLPVVQPRCGQPSDSTEPQFCVEGCDCPSGTLNYNGGCITPENCPCTYHNKSYSVWDVIPNDCNTCTCISGKWACTEVKCGARCSTVGDPHYKTFDGRRFDFMGRCSYYLVKGNDFSIEAENVACAGAISEAMTFPQSSLSDFPSCTKSVTLRVPGTTIELKQKGEIVINGIEVRDLPVYEGDIYVKRASSLFIIATLPNHMDVWWDGLNRVYVDAPSEMRNKTKGLCGTFNDNQKDDFLTSEEDIEQNAASFANKWKTMEKCHDSQLMEQPHPCERNIQRKEIAEKYCTRLRSKVFSNCHYEVDPDPHYRNCMYDMCWCEAKFSDCLCPVLASYGKECTEKGITLDWRSDFRECGMHCSGGQIYRSCGDSCTYTCYDISSNPNCKRKCVEGCACPEGFSLDSNEKCIPISHCPCLHQGKEYKTGYEMMQNASDPKICKCKKGQWDCRSPTDLEMSSPEFFSFPQVQCQSVRHEVYTDCVPGEEINCKNMHLRPELPPDTCRAGCVCDFGYVRNVDSGSCVRSIKCPCHHGGKSYTESEQILEECNTCTCKGGVWKCTTKECPARCTAWGDSHFKTFDGRIFDFHGICDYMLAKGKLSKTDSFEVTIQNIPCGTNGVTCAKSLSLRVGYGDHQEVVTFSRNKPVQERNMTRTIIRQQGAFVFAEVTDMGLVLQWDKGTLAYITLNPSWKNKVKGLCGNYNKDETDDFQTPSGGVAEESSKVFGDSWRLQNRCPESLIVKDTCVLHPHRKIWAVEKCAILQSDIFSPCHPEVPVEPYLERCQFDACGCDMGGDCHCLCTAIAAYAQECNVFGAPIRWRRPDFCPMQCDESCKTYQPCVSACPTETCESDFSQKQSLCHMETCIEGCSENPCLPGEVHSSRTNLECVPKSDCNKTCKTTDDNIYYDGELISEDDCHVCYCVNNKEMCKGLPCITTLHISTSTVYLTSPTSTPKYEPVIAETENCKSGWSTWLNNDHPLVYTKNSDIEQIPMTIPKTVGNVGFCQRDMVSDIRCRTTGHHQPPPTSVDCNLEDGLICNGPKTFGKGSAVCKDYEISVLCDCSASYTGWNTSSTSRDLFTTQEPDIEHMPYSCEDDGWSRWMNTHQPTDMGEYETVDELRKAISTCPDQYITNVECRPLKGPAHKETSCDKNGAICSTNGRKSKVCPDYEIRIFCSCDCQDGIGVEFRDRIADEQLSSSSSYSLDHGPKYGRLNGVSSWVPSRRILKKLKEELYGPEWIQVDLGNLTEITGILTQGSHEGYVTKFSVQTSMSGLDWDDVRRAGENHAYVFRGNHDSYSTVRNVFPSSVMAKLVRVIPLDYNLLPALRIELTGCGISDLFESSPHPITELTRATPDNCTSGWTPWINTNTPSPQDWNDIESLSRIRNHHPLCDDEAITKVECRVAGVQTTLKEGGQVEVSCDKNQGLQCIDVLQIWHCYDYEIRFLCDCGILPTTEQTVVTTPTDVEMICKPGDVNIQHAMNCQKFFKCDLNNKQRPMVEETCGPGTLFNPATSVCDFPYAVYAVRPECLDIEITTLRPSTIETTACSDHYWTEWYNMSHPNEDGGDYETVEAITAAVLDPCQKEYILDVECQFEATIRKSYAKGRGGKGTSRKGRYSKGHRSSSVMTELQDYSISNDYGVTCTMDEGLICNNSQQPKWRGGVCEDYSIRFLCSCESKSAIERTTVATYTTSPVQAYSDVRTSFYTTTSFMLNDYWCPPGRYYEKYAIRCTRVCIYYKQLLIQHGMCLSDDDEAPACVEEVSGQACPPGFFLRDNSTCVNIFDCNCMLHSGLSAPPGKALLVSDCEICECKSNDLICDNSKCFGQPKEFSCDEWSPWMSISTPSGEGDDESLIKMRLNNPEICWNPTNIECRDKRSGMTAEMLGQNILCDISVGLLCYNWLNLETCKDYEVRIMCPCSDKDDEPTGVIKPKTDCEGYTRRVVDCGAQCEDFCNDQEIALQQQGYCQAKYECVPVCLHYGQSHFCPENELISGNWTCVTANRCNCKLPDGRTVNAGAEVQVAKCEACKCDRNILKCETIADCLEIEVPIKSTETHALHGTSPSPFTLLSTTTSTSTLPSARDLIRIKCDDWTPWLNIKRSNEGDFQKLQDLLLQYEDLCDVPTNISCREANSKLPVEQLQQHVTCDPSVGLVCRNSENKERCFDYEVSFFCQCPPGIEHPEATTKGYGMSTESAPCSSWSPWINEHDPWRENGDTESKTLDQLREEYGFCEQGEIKDVECLEAGSGLPISINRNVRCDKKYGLRCLNGDQGAKICSDFKIRYYCSCDTTTTRPTVLMPTTQSPPSACDPSRYMNLLYEISDSGFTATSSQSSIYSAADARLNNPESASGGAWVPKIFDLNQFIQIDLGEPKLVYGLVTGGSAVVKGRVTSYSVQISNDELSWSFVQPQVLRGPVSVKDTHLVLFDYAVESRYLKISPLTWDKVIAMRIEVIGCSAPTATPMTATEGTMICSDKMGLSNGLLLDSQISVSSVFNDQEEYYGKRNIRLNTSLGGGAWVGTGRPGRQTEFVQIDFRQPTKISGVKTQGSDRQSEWVESFIIKYSPDGKIWSPIIDEATGKDKIFMANYDSDTVVTILFDRLIETRYMKLFPYSWRDRIALRFEVIGCFQPYPEEETMQISTTTAATPPSGCDGCPSLPPELYSSCMTCFSGQKFDGNECIPELLCPCYYDGRPYTLGMEFETSDCRECTCDLKGMATCEPLKCDPCHEKNERPITTAFCKCLCKPCPENTRLCPSNNFCVEEDKWCDGITHCPDDEVNCPILPPSLYPGCPIPDCPQEWTPAVKSSGSGIRCPQYECKPPTLIPTVPCQPPICPIEYIVVMEQLEEEGVCPKYTCALPAATKAPRSCPPALCPMGYESEITQTFEQTSQFEEDYDFDNNACPQFRCVTNAPPTAPCPPPHCPSGYDIEYGGMENMMQLCPIYDCIPKITTTICPPISCPQGLQTMYLESEETCPQYTCIRVTTPSHLPEMSTIPPCDMTVLPICEPGEEIYQTNPTEHCPLFKCKKIGSIPTTTMGPLEKTVSTCRIEGKVITTFDGSRLSDIHTCGHILARNKIGKKWTVSLLQNCTSGSGQCSSFVRIGQRESVIDLFSNLSVIWKKHMYEPNQASRIRNSASQFSLFHVGESLLFNSKINNFTVAWSTNNNIRIEMSKNLLYQVDGLCGQFTGHSDDDLSKPDGQIAASKKEYQESWLINGTKCIVTSTDCSKEERAEAFKQCNVVDSDPFTECHSVLPPYSFVQECVERLCGCQKQDNSEKDCRCGVISSYVTSCLEKTPQARLSNWRIAAKCYEECHSGEEYHDCYNYACEQSCGSTQSSQSCIDIPRKSCISGCFCEPGLVRRNKKCIVPELCRDCVCESYGNSHIVTYDRFNYSLISDCSFLFTSYRHPTEEHSFEVRVKNDQCNGGAKCDKYVTILIDNYALQLNAVNSQIKVAFNGSEVQTFPAKTLAATVEKLDSGHVSVFVDTIQLEVLFTLDNHGLTVRAPSSLYSGRLEGLCGNCNADDADDLLSSQGTQSSSIEKFGQSWTTGSTACKSPEEIKQCPTPLPEDDPCFKIMDKEIFGKCHLMEDPAPYLTSCQLDYCRGEVKQEAYCQVLEAYNARCAQMGICLDWRSRDLCQKNCSAGLKYVSCGSGCTKTCDNYEELENNPNECTLPPIDGCFCDDGMVQDNGECIPKKTCVVCDSEGHRGGDVWKTGVCTTCECSPSKGGVICNTKACAPDPVCSNGFILVEEQNSTDECCGTKKICELKPTEACPVADEPNEKCPFGKYHKLVHFPEIPCPEYICVCLERADCPEIVTPSDEELKDGEVWELDTSGCCDHVIKNCTGLCSEIDCQPFYSVNERITSEKHCCPDMYCAPPEDACIYEKEYSIEFSIQSQISETHEPTELHKVGEKWKDGACVDCECVKDHSNIHIPHAKCVTKTCQSIENHPDRKEYQLQEKYLNNVCCPQITRSACIEDGNVVQVNDTFFDPINGCSSVECKPSKGGGIEKVAQMFSCSKDCPLGWEYRESPLYPQVCCGDCQQVACEDEGKVKSIGEVWHSEDFCTEFSCQRSKGKIKVRTKQKQCDNPTPEDEVKYVYNETVVDGECCISYEITSCIANGMPLEVGQETSDEEDSCIMYSCEYKGDNIIRKEKEKSCISECPLGNVYVNPKMNSKECCGTCMQTQCVDNEELHPVGDTWENPNEKCFEYTCQIRDGTLTTVAIKRECPYFDPECPKDKIIKDPCCVLCNVTRETKKECQPEEIAAEETIGMFVLEASQVGKCTNYEPVSGFRKCNGQCDSGTIFVAEGTSASHESQCDCCKPSRFSQVKVPLKCEQGYTFDRIFVNIESCECQQCQSKRRSYANDEPINEDTLFHVPVINNDDIS